jgi:hypothetical protein
MCRAVACTRELSTVDGAHRTAFAKPRIRSPLRRALSLLTYCAALAVGANDPGHAADAPVYMPVKAPQFAPPPYAEPSWNWGAMLGAVRTASASVNSTAPGGFYKGAFDDVMAPYAGLFADFRIARFGSSSQPFGTWVLSIGPVVDVRHSSLSYNGTGGGVPVSDSGRLTQWDYLGVLKLTTPLTPASNLSIFAGGGGATLRPTGTPTGPGGPAITGSNTTPVFRAGAEVSQQIAGGLSVALQLAYQRTTLVSVGTTRPDERFRFGDNDSFMLGLTLNFNDLFQAPPPPPRRPGFIGQETTPAGGGGSTKVATDSGLQPTTEEAKGGHRLDHASRAVTVGASFGDLRQKGLSPTRTASKSFISSTRSRLKRACAMSSSTMTKRIRATTTWSSCPKSMQMEMLWRPSARRAIRSRSASGRRRRMNWVAARP